MPICIAGMHRSGTSMLTRLLHLCGLDLGPQDRLLQSAADNPEGFWESQPFVELNKQLLAMLGGAWHSLPLFTPGWERGERFEAIAQEARRLPCELALSEPWGWKDPRNSVTLPFWKSIWPDLRVIICVRNPLDVAHSLLARDQFSIGKSLRLWFDYHLLLLEAAPPGRRIVTHYDSFFVDPAAELQRLLQAAGMKASPEAIQSACGDIAAGMRHAKFDLDDLQSVEAPAEVVEMYRRLCADAGPVFAAARPVAAKTPGSLTNLIRLTMRLEARIAEQDRRIDDLTEQTHELETINSDPIRAVGEMRREVAESRTRCEELSRRVAELTDRLSARRHRYADKLVGFMRTITPGQASKRRAYARGGS